MIKRNNFFSMVELLVGMAVLTIMMAFLIKAFTSAEKLSSSANRSMNLFERSNMVLDFISTDIRQMTVSNLPRSQVPYKYEYDSDGNLESCSFYARLPFSQDEVTVNGDRQYPSRVLPQLITYEFDKSKQELSRTITYSSDYPDTSLRNTQKTEDLLEKVENFTISFKKPVYSTTTNATIETDMYTATGVTEGHDLTEQANYCELQIKLTNPSSSKQIVHRTFPRRIYFE